jgi:4a-hydroxytetrahydrobiopterin dehydratase
MNLKEQNCVIFKKGTPAMNSEEINQYSAQLPSGWSVIDNHKLQKEFLFKSYKEEMAFVQRVGEMAEEQNHHPDMYVGYNRVTIEFSTHDVGGLSVNDFIMAAKIENFKL